MKAFSVVVLAAVPFCFTPSVLANDVSTALQQSKVSANFRYRLEHVDQDNALDDAIASTLRSRLTVTTGKAYGFNAVVQLDNVSLIGNDNYNSSYNGKTGYSVVADPKGTDINQAFLSYQNEHGTSFSAGRQLVNHANQRFLGGVGWRQNEQTLDGYRLQHSFGESVNVELGHYYNVNRIFGPKGAAADQPGSFNTLTAQWQANAEHKFMAFGYDFEFDNWASRSSRTLGVDYQGKLAALPALSWQLALAKQESCTLLTGDANLRVVASKEQITVMGTIGLLCAMVENQLLSVDDAFKALDRMKDGKRRLPWPEAEKVLNALR